MCLGLTACYGGKDGEDGGADGTDTDPSGGDGASDGPVEDPPENVDLVPEGQSRRMTQSELDNTLDDLMADATQPARSFISEDEYTPYDNDYNLQQVSRTYVESMEQLSIDVANRLIDDPMRVGLVVPCTPTGPGDEACFRTFVETFGRRALRRPLTTAEVDAYVTLQAYSTEAIAEVDNDFYTGVALVISAIIQDPEFLYRLEVGVPTTVDGVYKLTDHEIAARISYLLWGTTPDDDLLAAADAGLLTEPVDRADAIDRLLNADRAKSQLHRYHAMWLGYRGIPHGQELVTAFNTETSALIDRVVFEDQASYIELFTSGETYVDDFLAGHYGLPAPAGGQGWVSYGDTGRAGILSHGSVLAAFSKFTDTSPTQRGILISERLRCVEIPVPPPTVDADNPPGDPDDPTACKEQRYADHREIASCAACHSLMDPIGLGLENYDIAGVFRSTDDGKPDCLISGQGELPGVGTFSGPGELADRLVESGELEACVARQYMTYALGRPVAAADDPAIDHVLQTFTDSGFNFKQMMAEYTADEAFGFRREPGT
jgi:hypothetical protein